MFPKYKTLGNETVIMAESKGALIAKSVQKHAGRAKEKVFIVFCTYLKVSVFVLKFYASAVKVDFVRYPVGPGRLRVLM